MLAMRLCDQRACRAGGGAVAQPTLKRIYEEFSKGNQWCVLIFDCEKGFEDAQHRLANRKEEHEQFRLVREGKVLEEKSNRSLELNI